MLTTSTRNDKESEILENVRKNFNILRLGSVSMPQTVTSVSPTVAAATATTHPNVIIISGAASNTQKYKSNYTSTNTNRLTKSITVVGNNTSNVPVSMTTTPLTKPSRYNGNRSQSSVNSTISISSCSPNSQFGGQHPILYTPTTIAITSPASAPAPPAPPIVPFKSPKDSSFSSINEANSALPSYGSTPSIVNRRHNNTTVTLMNADDTNSQRISVFDPYPMRDIIEHFCEKHLDKIRSYMRDVCKKVPLPAKCTIEERRTKKITKLYFTCALHGQHCLYSRTFFMIITRYPRIWIHLMFIALQSQSKRALNGRDANVTSLKHCWDMLKFEKQEFLTLVTGSFPCQKDLELILNELNQVGFFDVFDLNENWTKENQDRDFYNWCCCLCLRPERAVEFLKNTHQPVIEGQLKEKKGRWKLFRRWRTRYFTLSGAHLTYKGASGGAETIDITQIQSVKVSRGARNIPKAFEIFTQDKQSFILKPKNGKNAEEWVQCLNIVVAHSHAKQLPIKSNSLPARGFAHVTGKKSLKIARDLNTNLKYRSITDLIDNSCLLGYFIDYLEACKDLQLLKCWLEIENFESIVCRTQIDQLDPNFLDVYRNRISDMYFDCDFIRSLRTSGHRAFRDIQQSIAYYLTGNYLDGFLSSNYFRKYQADLVRTTKVTLLDVICDRDGFNAFVDHSEQFELNESQTFRLRLLADILQLLNDRLVLDTDFRLLCDRYCLWEESQSLAIRLTSQLAVDLKQFNCDNFQVVFRALAVHLVGLLETDCFETFLVSECYAKYVGELMDCCCRGSGSQTNRDDDDSIAGKSKQANQSKTIDKKPLFFGKIDKLGRFQTDLEPDPNSQQSRSKLHKTFRKFILFRNDNNNGRPANNTTEDVAWCVAEMIVKEVTDITLRQS